MFISAILVALLATCGQWWFFGPITKCLVYPLTTGTLVGVFMGDPMTGMLAGANIQLIYLGWISAGGTMPSNTIVAGIFGTAMTILSGADPTMAVTFAIPFSMLGLLQNQVYMTTNAAWIHQADKMLEKSSSDELPAVILYGIPAIWCSGICNGYVRKRMGRESNQRSSGKCDQRITGSWRHHACTWYCNASELSWKEDFDSMVLRRILPDSILRTGTDSSIYLRGDHRTDPVFEPG